MRKLDGTEFSAKKQRADTVTERKDEVEALRESWERIGNRHLERHGFELTLDRRSLLDQGVDREPTIHLGKAATAIEREGKASELGDLNRAITAKKERRLSTLPPSAPCVKRVTPQKAGSMTYGQQPHLDSRTPLSPEIYYAPG